MEGLLAEEWSDEELDAINAARRLHIAGTWTVVAAAVLGFLGVAASIGLIITGAMTDEPMAMWGGGAALFATLLTVLPWMLAGLGAQAFARHMVRAAVVDH